MTSVPRRILNSCERCRGTGWVRGEPCPACEAFHAEGEELKAELRGDAPEASRYDGTVQNLHAKNERLEVEHRQFVESLTAALAAHGVPACSSWRAAIDYLAFHGGPRYAEALRKLAGIVIADAEAMDRGYLHYDVEYEGIVRDRANAAARILGEVGLEPPESPYA